jgi:hypothetical protein
MYFVTVNGITVARNLNKDKAINLGMKQNNGNIGIGKYKMNKGKKVYILLPLCFFI